MLSCRPTGRTYAAWRVRLWKPRWRVAARCRIWRNDRHRSDHLKSGGRLARRKGMILALEIASSISPERPLTNSRYSDRLASRTSSGSRAICFNVASASARSSHIPRKLSSDSKRSSIRWACAGKCSSAAARPGETNGLSERDPIAHLQKRSTARDGSSYFTWPV